MWLLLKLELIFLVFLVSSIMGVKPRQFGDAELVHEWTLLDFDWPSEAEKEEAINNRSYVPDWSVIAGIKIYKNDIYLSIPRWFWTFGHPVTLAKIVHVGSQVILRPYPSWAAQKQGDCQALQYVWSMEIDPNTGLMYAIDTGRVGMTLNLCPAKIVIYDLNTDEQVDVHELPDDVVSSTKNFLNDIVLDYVNGQVRYAYISDANDGYLVVYDFQTRKAYNMEHSTMKASNSNDSVMNITGKMYNYPVPIDGITVSPDFKYVYYSVLGGYDLYQVPSWVLRNNASLEDNVRTVGRKVSQSDGIVHGSKRLYYGALTLNAVYYWDIEKDIKEQKLPIDKVTMATQVELFKNDEKIHWPDTFAFDNEGWLWFVCNSLHLVKTPSAIAISGNPKMRIWKVFVNETGYLYQAHTRTLDGPDTDSGAEAIRSEL